MKKNILYYLCFLLVGSLAISSCTKDEDENEFQEITNVKGAVLNISGTNPGIYNFGNFDETVTFTLDDFGEDISSATILASIDGSTPAEVTKVTSFPSTYTYSLTELAATIGVDPTTIELDDVAVFTFADVVTSSGTYPSGRSISLPITCPPQLVGTFDVKTTATGVFTNAGETYEGTVRIEAGEAGRYVIYTVEPVSGDELIDPSFGAYYAGWGTNTQDGLPNGDGEGDVTLLEACGVISYVGMSKWDETYDLTSLEVNGSVLNLVWENSYGEGGIVEITRTDDTDWASNLTN